MEMVLFMGIQASGKSTFYLEYFYHTHIRINLDMLRTRHRESILIHACLEAKQPFVVDNTNLTRDFRTHYIPQAQAAYFRVVGYYFESTLENALYRNAQRTGTARIPDRGIRGAYYRLQRPTFEEGFSVLYDVKIGEQGNFIVRAWEDLPKE